MTADGCRRTRFAGVLRRLAVVRGRWGVLRPAFHTSQARVLMLQRTRISNEDAPNSVNLTTRIWSMSDRS